MNYINLGVMKIKECRIISNSGQHMFFLGNSFLIIKAGANQRFDRSIQREFLSMLSGRKCSAIQFKMESTHLNLKNNMGFKRNI